MAQDDNSWYFYTLDNLGRVTHMDNEGTPGLPHVEFDLSYDEVGNRTGLSVTASGALDFQNAYQYDALNRLARVDQSDQGGNSVAEKRVDFQYNALGQFSSIKRFADVGSTELVVQSDYGYDLANRLTSLAHKQDTSTLAGYDWTYDALHRVTSFASLTDGTVTYTYDDTSQLTGADFDYQLDELHSYDLAGNRTDAGYSTGTNYRLLSDGTFNYTYDDEGNRTSRTRISTGEVTEYSWDHHNRLIQILEKDSQGAVNKTVDYTYDIFDRRLEKTITPAVGPSVVQQFIYDGQHIALQYENGNLANRYLHGPMIDQILADEQLDLSTGQTEKLLWPLADNLGTVRDLAEFDDVAGTTAVVNHIVYDSFGNITEESNAAIDHIFGYTGREVDAESDLMYYRARYYDPAVGRFVSEDPLGFAAGDVNVSRYVGNGATNATDPSGMVEYWMGFQVSKNPPPNQPRPQKPNGPPSAAMASQVSTTSIDESAPAPCGSDFELGEKKPFKNDGDFVWFAMGPGAAPPLNWRPSSETIRRSQEEARKFYSFSGDFATNVVPGVSDTRDAVEFTTGRDMIKQRKLTKWGRFLTGLGLAAPVVGAAIFRKAGRYFGCVDEIVDEAKIIQKNGDEILDGAKKLADDAPSRVRNATPSPALEGSPYHPNAVRDRVRPPYRANPAHDPRSPSFNPRKTPEPPDAASVYESAVRSGMGEWFGVGQDGKIYRFFSDNAGGVHFSGIVPKSAVPKGVRELLKL